MSRHLRSIAGGAALAAAASLAPGAGAAAQRPAYTVPEAPPVLVTPPGVSCAATPGRCFRIHYVTSTADAPDTTDAAPRNGVPDYVDDIRTALLEVYRSQVVEMGWEPPPSDGSSPTDGGDGRHDVYVAAVSCDDIAVVQGEGAVAPGSRSWYSFIVLAADVKACYDDPGINTGPGDLAPLSRLDVVRDVVAHEYHHAVQNGLNHGIGRGFKEATSNWINDEVYDDINANVHSAALGDFELFTDPGSSLASQSYGGWFWLRYLSERFGRDVVRDVWRRLGDGAGDPLAATEAVLAARGTTLRAAWTDFSGKLLARDWFEEGATWPDLRESGLANAGAPHAAWPLGAQQASVDRLTRRYFLFTPAAAPPSPGVVRLFVNGPDGPDAGAVVVAYTADGRAIDLPVALDGGSDGSITVSGFGAAPPPASEASRVASLVLVLTSAGPDGADPAFSYCAPDCGGVDGPDPAITPWGAESGYRAPLWQTGDVWVDNDGDCAPDAPGRPGCGEPDDPATPEVDAEPAKGRGNTLVARVRNLGNAPSGDVVVRLLYAPCVPGTLPASLVEIGARTVRLAAAGDPAGGDVQAVSLPWSLADLAFDHGGAWDVPGTPAAETLRDFGDLCVRVSVEAPGDLNPANNQATHHFGGVGP